MDTLLASYLLSSLQRTEVYQTDIVHSMTQLLTYVWKIEASAAESISITALAVVGEKRRR